MINGNLLNVSEAAELLGVTVGRVRQMLDPDRKTGAKLKGIKANGRAWLIPKKEIDRMKKNPPPKGRPSLG